MKKISKCLLVALLMMSNNFFCQNKDTEHYLSEELGEGEAYIWYLYHSGWAVRTKSHFLVFDYIERGTKPDNASLSNGFIELDELAGNNVYVFVSHSHSDHFDRSILEWEHSLDNIKYIFGWNFHDKKEHPYFGESREVKILTA